MLIVAAEALSGLYLSLHACAPLLAHPTCCPLYCMRPSRGHTACTGAHGGAFGPLALLLSVILPGKNMYSRWVKAMCALAGINRQSADGLMHGLSHMGATMMQLYPWLPLTRRPDAVAPDVLSVWTARCSLPPNDALHIEASSLPFLPIKALSSLPFLPIEACTLSSPYGCMHCVHVQQSDLPCLSICP